MVGEDIFECADALEGSVVKLVFGLDARDERRGGYALAGWLRCFFPIAAVEDLLENCGRSVDVESSMVANCTVAKTRQGRYTVCGRT